MKYIEWSYTYIQNVTPFMSTTVQARKYAVLPVSMQRKLPPTILTYC